MCGADLNESARHSAVSGSPPRVRSRQSTSAQRMVPRRITSACAEQTWGNRPHPNDGWDHLRVCGADPKTMTRLTARKGSPPRVRSRLLGCAADEVDGITSACAEQTMPCSRPRASVGDHLRVCGADILQFLFDLFAKGSPPRVRSRPPPVIRPWASRGITSACAEQTTGTTPPKSWAWDHLRVCGADPVTVIGYGGDGGSPPRVRSRLRRRGSRLGGRGITSACAEQTSSSIV